jgi:hypothetical protein
MANWFTRAVQKAILSPNRLAAIVFLRKMDINADAVYKPIKNV